mgnify:CR=1 FL=1
MSLLDNENILMGGLKSDTYPVNMLKSFIDYSVRYDKLNVSYDSKELLQGFPEKETAWSAASLSCGDSALLEFLSSLRPQIHPLGCFENVCRGKTHCILLVVHSGGADLLSGVLGVDATLQK